MDGQSTRAEWVDVASVADLSENGRRVVKIDGKQIAVFATKAGIVACNNRCPHEGYPLSEGTITDECVLTCNWHNWKFDLKSGETLIGGDRLRRYPADVRDGRIWLDLSEPSATAVTELAINDMLASFDDHDYGQMVRELARIQKAGGDVLDAMRAAITATADRFEYGMSHALAAAADWLALYHASDDPVRKLAAAAEVVSHVAWDTRKQPAFPYWQATSPFDPQRLIDAIEAEDEVGAIALVRGALAAGKSFEDLREPLSRAALAHYQDFGHALIYVVKAGEVIDRLGPEVTESVVLQLTRSLVYATREDLIPEFSAYAPALANWEEGADVPNPTDLRQLGTRQVLDALSSGGGDPKLIYDAVLAAGCWQMLHMDLSYSQSTRGPVQDNVGWLDFTHTITFANAVRHTCERYLDLWPAGLLQIGCFLGRNAKYTDASLCTSSWAVDDPLAFVEDVVGQMLDHGAAEYIVAAHLIKLPSAMADELRASPGAPWAADMAAALNRFINSPLKRKHVLRTAAQSIDLVAREA